MPIRSLESKSLFFKFKCLNPRANYNRAHGQPRRTIIPKFEDLNESMDGDRLFGLLDKLSSSKLEVRLRSCRSLQFKLRHQLIDCSEPTIVGKIAEALVRSMTPSQTAPRTEESREEVELVVDIIRACRPCLCTEAALAAVTANLIELLQQLVDSAMLPTVIQIEVKTLLRELQEYSPPEPPAALAFSSPSERTEPSPFLSKETIEGAGAILYSRLCYYGIHLPTIKLCDADERFLFDVEVSDGLQSPLARILDDECLA